MGWRRSSLAVGQARGASGAAGRLARTFLILRRPGVLFGGSRSRRRRRAPAASLLLPLALPSALGLALPIALVLALAIALPLLLTPALV